MVFVRTEPMATRFWRYVQKSEGCWLWTGLVTQYGYGRFSKSHRDFPHAHRVAWELTNGPIPEITPCVLHRCDVRLCVRPDHLFLGTKRDNMRDRDAKQRQAKGEHAGLVKLTAEQVLAIRHAYTGRYGQSSALARQYGISTSTMFQILHRQTWKHI